MKKIILTFLILFLVFGFNSVSANNIAKPTDYENIIDESDYIFIGFPVNEGKSRKITEENIVTVWEIMPYIILKGSQKTNKITLRTSGGNIKGKGVSGVNLNTNEMYIFFLKREKDPFLWDTVNNGEISIRPVKSIEYDIVEFIIRFENSDLVNALDNYMLNNKLNKYKIEEVR